VRVAVIGFVGLVTLSALGSIGGGSDKKPGANAASPTPSQSTPSSAIGTTAAGTAPRRKHRHHHHAAVHKPKRRHHHHGQPVRAGAAAACPSAGRTLAGVYHPSRLVVLNPCEYAAGVVDDVRHEEDGDLHIIVHLASAYTHLLDGDNYSQQDGDLVVEFMARDGGHLPAPSVGARLAMIGAWVLDSEHGWREIHPVFWDSLAGRTYRSGPQYGGSPAGDYSSTAAEDCRTQTGAPCAGYSGGSTGGGGGSGGGGPDGSSGGSCEPGYTPCLPITGDLDCGEISDALKPIHVTGSDPYRLDSDGDGLGCE
jgi:hypothetical protein